MDVPPITPPRMRVFGIDPGSVVTGYGVVESSRGRLVLVDAGCIRTSSDTPMPMRLTAIYEGLCEALERNAPEQVAIEAIFKHKSSESALRLGQARGVALLAAVGAGAYKNVVEACDATIHTVKETKVQRAAAGYYNRGFPLYQQLYRSLKNDFKRIAELDR